MKGVDQLLEKERAFERKFARDASSRQTKSRGWTTPVLFFHFLCWRERLLVGLDELRAGRPVTAPPSDVDALNDRELAEGRSLSLDAVATRSQEALDRIIDLWSQIGDRPFKWYSAVTTSDAVIRSSYSHPRYHIAEHMEEAGQRKEATMLLEATLTDLRTAEAPPNTLAPAGYNLASLLAREGRLDYAMRLLEEAVPLRADLPEAAAADPDLAPLRDNPRFIRLVGQR